MGRKPPPPAHMATALALITWGSLPSIEKPMAPTTRPSCFSSSVTMNRSLSFTPLRITCFLRISGKPGSQWTTSLTMGGNLSLSGRSMFL